MPKATASKKSAGEKTSVPKTEATPRGAEGVEADMMTVARKAEDLQCRFEEGDEPEVLEIADDDLMARMQAHQASTGSHRKAVTRLAVPIRTIEHARRSLKANWMDEGKSAWDRAKEEFSNDFDRYLLHIFEKESVKEKLQPNTKATYASIIKELRLQALDTAEKRVHSKILQTAVKIDADEHVTPAKVILSKEEVINLISEPREKGASTAQQKACEPFLVVFLWLLFVTGGRCENLWNAGPVTFLKDRVLVHWTRRKGGRHHPRCATPYLYSWSDLSPTPALLETIKRICTVTQNRSAIPWTALAGCGGKVENPSQKMNNWMKCCPLVKKRQDTLPPGCARDYFVNRLFVQRIAPGSKIDNNLYQFLADHSVSTALASYIDLNQYFSEEEVPSALVEALGDRSLSWMESEQRAKRPLPATSPSPSEAAADLVALKEEVRVLREEHKDQQAVIKGLDDDIVRLYQLVHDLAEGRDEVEGSDAPPEGVASVTSPPKRGRSEAADLFQFLSS